MAEVKMEDVEVALPSKRKPIDEDNPAKKHKLHIPEDEHKIDQEEEKANEIDVEKKLRAEGIEENPKEIEFLEEEGKEEIEGNEKEIEGNEDSEEDEEDYEADEEDDEDEDENESNGEEAEVIDRKGKGIMVDNKGKGKMIEVSDHDSSDDDGDECVESDFAIKGDSDFSDDDPLAGVDLDNILPSRTRSRRNARGGLCIPGGNSKGNDDDDDA